MFTTTLKNLKVPYEVNGKEIFVHFDDVPNKATEQKITAAANQYGLQVIICDKGAVFVG